MIKKLRNAKMRTQFFLVILIAGFCSYLLFSSLWHSRWKLLDYVEEKLELFPQLYDETFWSGIYEEALKYDVPKNEKDTETAREMEPFFELFDSYTSVYIYGLEDGMYRTGKYAEIMDNSSFRSIFDFGYRMTGGEGEDRRQIPIQFKNEMALLDIAFYHRSKLVYPYALFSSGISIAFFLIVVLFFIRQKMQKVVRLKEEVLRMASGDLTHPLPDWYQDEIGILSSELDHLRVTLGETIQNEQESRAANQNLITALSHDLRTPLTILTGYLEVLRLNRNPQDSGKYLERCMQKTKDIKEMTDRMFEYALVFEHTETPVLTTMDSAALHSILSDNCDFLRLLGFQVTVVFPEDACSFTCDESMLKRIFTNLFSNIIKYGEKKQPVKICVALEHPSVIVRFTNGIKQEHSNVESNRIGLKSVEKMMQLMGGRFHTLQNADTFHASLVLPKAQDHLHH